MTTQMHHLASQGAWAGPANRSLWLVDVECAAGTPRLDDDLVAVTQVMIESAVAPTADDLVVVGASGSANLVAAAYAWRGPARFVYRPCADGADRALLNEIDSLDFVAQRFDRTIIVTGDHIFAPKVALMKALGLDVLVVAPRGGTATALRIAAGPDIRFFDRPRRDDIHVVAV